MEYRGVEYAVVRTIPNGWRWSVKRGHNEKVGTSYDRESAIARADASVGCLMPSAMIRC